MLERDVTMVLFYAISFNIAALLILLGYGVDLPFPVGIGMGIIGFLVGIVVAGNEPD